MFDLEEHLSRIRAGKAELVQRRTDLKESIAKLNAELEDVEADLERIDGLDLDAIIGPEPMRMGGVLQLVEKVAVEMLEQRSADPSFTAAAGVGLTEDAILEEVRKREPAVKETSVRSALARLAEKGRLSRAGKRGSRVYGLGRPESGPPPAAGKGPRDAVLLALRSAGEDGLSRKQLAWAAGDAAIVDELLGSADVTIETFEAEGEQRFRIKPEPGQRPLFPGADVPASAKS